MKKIKAYWWPAKNFGDMLTPIILERFRPDLKIEQVDRKASGKLLMVGSIMVTMRPGDTILGTGSNRPHAVYHGRGCKFLAFRGPLTRSQVKGVPESELPEVYGDPGLLLPLIYNPKVRKTTPIGYLPHYIDKYEVFKKHKFENGIAKYIDIQSDWKKVIEEVKSCQLIVASSLHGIVCAEAYGIPVIWEQYTAKIRGGDYKYQDYFLGTGRTKQAPGEKIPPIEDLAGIQNRLLHALEKL